MDYKEQIEAGLQDVTVYTRIDGPRLWLYTLFRVDRMMLLSIDPPTITTYQHGRRTHTTNIAGLNALLQQIEKEL